MTEYKKSNRPNQKRLGYSMWEVKFYLTAKQNSIGKEGLKFTIRQPSNLLLSLASLLACPAFTLQAEQVL